MVIIKLGKNKLGSSKCCSECLRFIKTASLLGIKFSVKYIDVDGAFKEFTDNDEPNIYSPPVLYW